MKYLLILTMFSSWVLADSNIEFDTKIREKIQKIQIFEEENKELLTEARQWQTIWFQNFINYLVQQSNPNLQVIGLIANKAQLKENQKEFDDVVLQIYNNKDSSPITLFKLYQLLEYSQSDLKVLRADLLSKFQGPLKDNLIIYLSDLNQAQKNSDITEMARVMKNMSDAKFADSYSYFEQDLYNEILTFAEQNPMPSEYIDVEMKRLMGENYSLTRLISGEQLNRAVLNVNVIGFQMAQSIPSYRPITSVCRDSEDFISECLSIANTLTNNGKTEVEKFMGIAIYGMIYKFENNLILVQQNEEKRNQYGDQFMCIINTYQEFEIGIMLLGDSSSEFMIESDQTEFERHYQLAEEVYQFKLKHNLPNAKNPKDCLVHEKTEKLEKRNL